MTKEQFKELLARGPVILDGATGSNLMKAGMPRGACTEGWVKDNPQVLLDLQRAYAKAGSQIIYAPTFSANRHSLARHDMADRVQELNTALAAITKEIEGVLVAGDMTTTGVPLEPLGDMESNRLFEIYQEQARALYEAGVDLIVVETMLALDETAVALEAIQSVCDLPVMCTVSIQADGGLYFGGNCFDAVQALEELGADAVGINCSLGPEQLVSIVRNLRELIHIPLIVKPNAGMPVISDEGEAVYPMDPETFAKHMEGLVEAGADLVGGCCGTSPEYIAALTAKLKEKAN